MQRLRKLIATRNRLAAMAIVAGLLGLAGALSISGYVINVSIKTDWGTVEAMVSPSNSTNVRRACESSADRGLSGHVMGGQR